MMKTIRKYANILVSSAQEFYTDNYSYQSSALAYTMLLTLVPIFTVSIYIIASLPIFNTIFESVKHYVFTNFVPASSVVIEKNLNTFTRHANKLPVTSIIFLGVSAVLLIVQVKNTINAIWGSPKYTKVLTSILHFIVIISMPVIIGLGIYISNVVFQSSWLTESAARSGMSIFMPVLFSIFINSLSFTIAYLLLPSRHVKLTSGIVGGLTAGTLFEIAKRGFALYIELFPTYEVIYGALAAIPIFLIWLYITWSIIIYGAIVSKNYSQPRHH